MLKKFFTGLILALLLIACSSDEGGSNNSDNQDQINAIAGTWHLVEIQVNPPQDVDEDGTASGNLLEELECLSGTLVLTTSFDWDLTIVEPSIISITEGDFAISCAPVSTTSGVWAFQNSQLLLARGSEVIPFLLNGTTLTLSLGEDLPGVDQYVYEKQ